MKLAFVTNYYNHHQKFLSDSLYSMLGNDYCFIETEPISEERLKMGWGGETKPSYVFQSYTDGVVAKNKCQDIIDSADIVILGNAPYSLIKTRLKKGLPILLYGERMYKRKARWHKLLYHFFLFSYRYKRFNNIYALCASAYAATDYSRTHSFIGKTYKWGYFPETKRYENIDALIDAKTPNSIMWTARMIDWKHPEKAIEVAKRLKEDGYHFTLNMIGNGILEEYIRKVIADENLEDCVKLLGVMKPEEVRKNMEKSEIFLMTSDRNEGWGAVLNESMNSACAVVADSEIGSVPFLLKDGENGYISKNGNIDEFYNKVKNLLDNPEERKRLSKNAYSTIEKEWNAENAAKKLIILCEKMLAGEYKPFPFNNGVCSKADFKII